LASEACHGRRKFEHDVLGSAAVSAPSSPRRQSSVVTATCALCCALSFGTEVRAQEPADAPAPATTPVEPPATPSPSAEPAAPIPPTYDAPPPLERPPPFDDELP